jgi:hypothetical protein
MTPNGIILFLKADTYVTGIWRAPSGAMYATAPGEILTTPGQGRPGSDKTRSAALPGGLSGVWGLDDDFVFAWGLTAEGGGVCYLKDGANWRAVKAPGVFQAIHGASRDAVIGVGLNGLIARWDGAKWVKMKPPTDAAIHAVFVAGADEAYALSFGGVVLSGSLHGWSTRLETELEIQSVAKWRDRVWLGCGAEGLGVLEQRAVKIVKDTFYGGNLDARTNLLIAARGKVVQSVDGTSFVSSPLSTFAELMDAEP